MVGISLAQGNSTTNARAFDTGTVRPTANMAVLAFVASARNAGVATAAEPTLTGTGMTWEQVTTLTTGVLGERRLTCFRAVATAPVDSAVTIDFGTQQQDYCAWSVIGYTGVDFASTPDRSGVVGSRTGSAGGETVVLQLDPAAGPRNVTVGAVMVAGFNAPPREVDTTTGFTEIAEQRPNQPVGRGATLQTQDVTPPVGSITWRWSGSGDAVAIGVEIAVVAPVVPPVATDPVEQLIRAFEPILHLHPEEQFVPVDAKRYVEHAALWRASFPYDDNDNWGGRALVDRDQLSAAISEPGKYLGDENLLVGPPDTELFLELGGWKDESEMPEPDITDTSSNRYSGAEAIATRYRDEQSLRDSRFWYHAEYFDNATLMRMAGGAPNYTKTLQYGLSTPSLLCYYLFFPHHRQTVSQDGDFCQGKLSATEVSSHAGDWHCVAILLDGDGTAAGSEPKFIGTTTPGPEPSAEPAEGFRPFQNDPDNEVAMRVEMWQPATGQTAGLPVDIDRHPQLFVAQGSHGLYLSDGDHRIFPYRDGPLWCGEYDNSSVAPPGLGQDSDDDSFLEDLGAWLGILLASLSLGFAAGVVIAAVAGRLPTPSGLDIVGTGDSPDPDRTAAGGTTVAPAGLTVPGAVTTQAWTTRQNLVVDGRRYDMKVDRTSQIWWPGTDGESGYRGRWGQRVSSDTTPRRSGPLFPDFVTMFLGALEYGRSNGFFPRTG
ncbi:hypothetical protein [Williamsia sp.]|uniref:hypothetical protein n=1 Tax=Williamsia sp. TaxID=1872085 RepID=UPI001A20F143|nr:hypothetical protein [Williamsia sp.]MBJ7289980.1 hypothetical protein [Williamsia sp.]